MVMSQESQRAERRYNFIVPPGWLRLDLRGPVRPEVQRFAGVMLADAPRDRSAAVRAALESQITKLAESSRAEGVLDLVLPARIVDGAAVTASFAVMAFDTAELDPVEVIAGLAARDDSARLVEIADLVALRTEETVTADQQAVLEAAVATAEAAGLAPDPSEAAELSLPVLRSRRVRYFLGHPDRPDDWIIAALSAAQSDSPESVALTDTIVELFDEIMLTVRFDQ